MSEQKAEAAGRNGSGHTSARRVAQLRRLLLSRISEEQIGAIFDKLVELALEGNLAAIKLVLQYTIGKPGPASDLDLPSLADPVPEASGVRPPPVAAPSKQSADALRPLAEKRDLLRQIEQAVQMPQTLVNLPLTGSAMAPGGRR